MLQIGGLQVAQAARRGRREDAGNQEEQENLLGLFSWSFPVFSPFEFPLRDEERVWMVKALEVELSFAILKQHWPTRKKKKNKKKDEEAVGDPSCST